MSWLLASLIILGGLFFSALFSGAETGLYCANRLRLHLGAQQGDPSALRIAGMLADPQGALSVTLIGTNLANYVTTSAVAYALGNLTGLREINTEVYTIVILTPVVFVFGEVVPKNLFQRHADYLLARAGRILVVINRLFRLTGVVWGLKLVTGLVGRITGGQPQAGLGDDPKRWVAGLLQEALADHTYGPDQSDLVDRVCQLSETPLYSVMVPRNRVRTSAAHENRRELTKTARRTPHGLLPVHDAHPRHIIGLVRVDDLLASEDWDTVGERVSQVAVLRPHETVASAISTLQRTGREMAVVADRGGQMLGIVTLRDLIEAIVG